MLQKKKMEELLEKKKGILKWGALPGDNIGQLDSNLDSQNSENREKSSSSCSSRRSYSWASEDSGSMPENDYTRYLLEISRVRMEMHKKDRVNRLMNENKKFILQSFKAKKFVKKTTKEKLNNPVLRRLTKKFHSSRPSED